MPGIYIHVPFCRKKCVYCDFYSVGESFGTNRFTSALLKEIQLQKGYFGPIEKKIETIYLGGGTPSLLSIVSLNQIIKAIGSSYSIVQDAEITMEVNPDDMSLEYLKGLRGIGINRLSIGVQSFSDFDLKFLGRRHDATSAINSVKMAQKGGFSNISIDLIYGIPSSSKETWEQNLKTAFSLGIQHLSCYHLTIEPKTPLFLKWKKGQVMPIAEDQSEIQFRILRDYASENGFDHYEISNLCIPGFESKHNSAYWNGVHYLGLGPSAHSFNGKSRSWNPSSLKIWTQSIESGMISSETELLTEADKLNEYIMVSLRTSHGLHIESFKTMFGEPQLKRLLKIAKKHIDTGRVIEKDGRLKINPDFFIISDSILIDYIVPK
jgi:oxygen-independent coproporphyrinogen III oxidase